MKFNLYTHYPDKSIEVLKESEIFFGAHPYDKMRIEKLLIHTVK